MFKFIRNKGHQPSAERQKLQRELFAYRKTVQHGFPNKPTCVVWDPELRLMAIGTASGSIKIVGQPGVEFYGHLPTNETSITRMLFIPNEGRLVSLSDNNTLQLWEINDTTMEETKSLQLEGKMKKISSLSPDGQTMLLGTEGGNIFCLHLPTFTLSDTVIYQDVVMQNVPEDYKINPGAVECVAPQPDHPGHILVGYNRGLMVLWNRATSTAVQTYVWGQQLESVCWNAGGLSFMSAHNDGSHTTWDVTSGEPRGEPTTPYGPFPCKAITKLVWAQTQGDELLLYAGGMPRASFSDRHTITAQQGKKHVVFDFTSRVIDFFTVEAQGDRKEVTTLIVLLEEELVAIDLTSDSWSPLQQHYLVSLHASAVTCSTYVSDVSQAVYDQIVAAGKQQSQGVFSDAPWPIDGGTVRDPPRPDTDLLLTGHEDGSVRVWRGGQVALSPIYKFASSTVLCADDDQPPPAEEEEDEWPPFRKVGSFDPYSDDPRLAVKKICLCPETGVLVVAGTAGHVLTARLSDTAQTKQIKVTSLNIVSDRDKFVWKGHEKLGVKDSCACPVGYQVESVLQLHPPAAVTALALHAGWQLVAAGTAHGLALYDYQRHVPVTFKCTLNPNDLSGVGDAPISRRKSFKKSLRESFRRLRKGRSGRHGEKRGAQSPTPTDRRKDRATVKADDAVSESPSLSRGGMTPTTPLEAKPVERAVEARPVDDALGSMVRCLSFARTYIISVQNATPTLWAGTNNGTVYVFTIAVPAGNKRSEEPVNSQLGKEIQLKHRAPVITVSVIDGECNEVETRQTTECPPPHRVIITSEEQIKIFTLPALKPLCKLKLTAGEGARVRRTALSRFCTSAASPGHTETCLLCLTNMGDVIVLNLPELRRQINAAVIRREDINGISSLVFTREGEALYLHSSSELQRISLSAAHTTVAHCGLELPAHARTVPAHDTSDDQSSSDSESSDDSSSSSSSDSDSQQAEEEEKQGEVKENGLPETDLTCNHLDLSSVGDITIDSVKDHLVNSATEESRIVTTELVRNETTKLETTTESVVVKTTVITTNETTLITPPSEPSTDGIVKSSVACNGAVYRRPSTCPRRLVGLEHLCSQPTANTWAGPRGAHTGMQISRDRAQWHGAVSDQKEMAEPKKLSRWYFGGMASAGAACCTHPLDLLKVHLQTQQEGKLSVVRLTGTIVREQGVLALYNGLSASLCRQLSYSTTRFGIYEVAKQTVAPHGESISFPQRVAMAGAAGAAGGFIGTPADLVNVRMQNDIKLSPDKRRNYKHAIDGLFRVYREEGVTRLFAGATTATSRAVFMTIGQLSFYDQVKLMLLASGYFQDNLTTHFLSSLTAGAVATTLTQPLDVLKTRAMNAKPGEFKGMMDLILYTAKLGPLGFFKGYVPAFVRLAPHTILTFVFLEQLRDNFGFVPAK